MAQTEPQTPGPAEHGPTAGGPESEGAWLRTEDAPVRSEDARLRSEGTRARPEGNSCRLEGAQVRPEGAPTGADAATEDRPESEPRDSEAPRPSARTVVPLGRNMRLLAAAFAIAVLADRLLFLDAAEHPFVALPAFWACAEAIVGCLYARRAWRSPMWWTVGAAMLSLDALVGFGRVGVGSFAGLAYAAITMGAAMPALMMAFVRLGAGDFDVRRPSVLIGRWFAGFTVDLVSHWGALRATATQLRRLVVEAVSARRSAADAGSDDGRPASGLARGGVGRQVAIALGVCVPLLLVLVPLLMQSDQVFALAVETTSTRFVDWLSSGWDPGALLMHALVLLLLSPVLFSLFAAVDDDRRGPISDGGPRVVAQGEATLGGVRGGGPAASLIPAVPAVPAAVVLGVVLALYAAFCGVQFTFLFARHGLPYGLTYAGYARSGFFQLLAVAGINLAGIGVCLAGVARSRVVSGMLAGLVAATGVMLASAALRLHLYVGAYGLTWLRLVSLTFIGCLAVILLLALARVRGVRVPLMAAAFVVAVVWWVALGALDPGGFVEAYNLAHGFAPA